MSVHKPGYNKGLFVCRILSNDIIYIYNLYTHPPSCYSDSRNYHLSLPRPRMDIFKTSLAFWGIFLWNSLPLTIRSCHLLSSFNPNFVCTLKQLHRVDYKRKLLERERKRFLSDCHWWALEWLVIWDVVSTPIDFCPVLPTACLCDFFPLPCCCLYEISTDCFCVFSALSACTCITEWYMHVCTLCIWHCEHIRFLFGSLYALCIHFYV